MAKNKPQTFPDLPLITGGENVAPQMCGVLRTALGSVSESLTELFCEDENNLKVGKPLIDLGVLDENLSDASAKVQKLSLSQVCTAISAVLKNLEGISSAPADGLRAVVQEARQKVRAVLADLERERQEGIKGQKLRIGDLLSRLHPVAERGISTINPGDLLLGVAMGGKFYLGGNGFEGIGFVYQGGSIGKCLTLNGAPATTPTVAVATFDGNVMEGRGFACTMVEPIPQKWVNNMPLPKCYERARGEFLKSESFGRLNEGEKLQSLMQQISPEVVVEEGDIILINSKPKTGLSYSYAPPVSFSNVLGGPQKILFDGKEWDMFSGADIVSTNADKFPLKDEQHMNIARIKRVQERPGGGLIIEVEILAILPERMKSQLFGANSVYQKAQDEARKAYELQACDAKIKGPSEDIHVGDYIIAKVLPDGRCIDLGDDRYITGAYEHYYQLNPELILHMDSRGQDSGFYVVKRFGSLTNITNGPVASIKQCQAYVEIVKPASPELMAKTGYAGVK